MRNSKWVRLDGQKVVFERLVWQAVGYIDPLEGAA